MLRDISSLVGHTTMLQYMSALVQQGYQQLVASSDQQQHLQQQAGGSGGGALGWERLECSLYAANVVVGRWVAETWQQRRPGKGGGPAGMAAAAAAHRIEEKEEGEEEEEEDSEGDEDSEEGGEEEGEGSGQPNGVPLPSSLSRRSKPKCDGSGKSLGLGPEADAAVGQLVAVAAAASLADTATIGSLKLAGTALTLLGGLAPWFVRRGRAAAAAVQRASSAVLRGGGDAPMAASDGCSSSAAAAASAPEGALASVLSPALSAVLHSAQSPDAKLSRNGATTLQVGAGQLPPSCRVDPPLEPVFLRT